MATLLDLTSQGDVATITHGHRGHPGPHRPALEFFEQRGKLPGPFGEWELLGYTSAEVNEFAFNALSRRLKVIGVGLPG
jgi:hypothetical protein